MMIQGLVYGKRLSVWEAPVTQPYGRGELSSVASAEWIGMMHGVLNQSQNAIIILRLGKIWTR